MITLKELQDISEGVKNKKAAALKEENRIYTEKQDIEYYGLMSELSLILKEAAMAGKTEKVVYQASAYSDNFSSELYTRRKGANYYVSWGKSINQKDIIETMRGNFGRIYNRLIELGFTPVVKYWTDGCGIDEGFQIIIKW